ncbi:MAG: hypothetical protein ABIJ42_10320 [Acidobacteriota bacterium]
MFKRIIATVFFITIFASCSGNQVAEVPEGVETQAELLPSLVPQDLLDNPEQYVGQTVTLTGTVQHVCEITGKRMFVSGLEDPGKTFKVTAGRDIGEFSIELNGSDVIVKGEVKVQKIDQAYLDNWETELSTGVKPEAAHQGHGPEGEDHESEEEGARIQLEKMRETLAGSGKDQLLFYSLECVEYSEEM